MTRRGLFLLAVNPEKPAPVSEERMNRFAGLWNQYVEQLKIGIIDLRQWRAVLKAWESLR